MLVEGNFRKKKILMTLLEFLELLMRMNKIKLLKALQDAYIYQKINSMK
jgi:hypothetical protein